MEQIQKNVDGIPLPPKLGGEVIELSSSTSIIDLCSTSDDLVSAPYPTPVTPSILSRGESRDTLDEPRKRRRRRIRKHRSHSSPDVTNSRRELHARLENANMLIRSMSLLLTELFWRVQDDEELTRRVASHLMQANYHKNAM